jgi:hypothetical protein
MKPQTSDEILESFLAEYDQDSFGQLTIMDKKQLRRGAEEICLGIIRNQDQSIIQDKASIQHLLSALLSNYRNFQTGTKSYFLTIAQQKISTDPQEIEIKGQKFHCHPPVHEEVLVRFV